MVSKVFRFLMLDMHCPNPKHVGVTLMLSEMRCLYKTSVLFYVFLFISLRSFFCIIHVSDMKTCDVSWFPDLIAILLSFGLEVFDSSSSHMIKTVSRTFRRSGNVRILKALLLSWLPSKLSPTSHFQRLVSSDSTS